MWATVKKSVQKILYRKEKKQHKKKREVNENNRLSRKKIRNQ